LPAMALRRGRVAEPLLKPTGYDRVKRRQRHG
jgi:hypothetical protein